MFASDLLNRIYNCPEDLWRLFHGFLYEDVVCRKMYPTGFYGRLARRVQLHVRFMPDHDGPGFRISMHLVGPSPYDRTSTNKVKIESTILLRVIGTLAHNVCTERFYPRDRTYTAVYNLQRLCSQRAKFLHHRENAIKLTNKPVESPKKQTSQSQQPAPFTLNVTKTVDILNQSNEIVAVVTMEGDNVTGVELDKPVGPHELVQMMKYLHHV